MVFDIDLVPPFELNTFQHRENSSLFVPRQVTFPAKNLSLKPGFFYILKKFIFNFVNYLFFYNFTFLTTHTSWLSSEFLPNFDITFFWLKQSVLYTYPSSEEQNHMGCKSPSFTTIVSNYKIIYICFYLFNYFLPGINNFNLPKELLAYSSLPSGFYKYNLEIE